MHLWDRIRSLLLRGLIDDVDRLVRGYCWDVYCSAVSRWGWFERLRFVEEVTGGVGDRGCGFEWDFGRIVVCGCVVAWPEVVRRFGRVFEVGTGVGRTCYCVLSCREVSLYVTVDVCAEVLAIALYDNPIPHFQRALWSPVIKVILGDARDVVPVLLRAGFRFDHIIHDGGVNPEKSWYLYTPDFLEKLVSLLRRGGTMSVFGGRNPRVVDRVYRTLRELGLEVETVSFPDAPVRVFHCWKR